MDAGELLFENNVLKKRLQEQTQLFEELDNDHQQEVQQLKQSNKELLDKVHMLEAKLTTVELNNAELNEMIDQLKLPGKPVPAPQPEIISMLSESFVADYDNLQDQVESLHEHRNKLETALAEGNLKYQELMKANEDLQKKNAEQQQMIKAMGSTNRKLANEIKECRDEIMGLHQQAETFKKSDASKSLMEELDMKIMEENLKKAEKENQDLMEENRRLLAEMGQMKRIQSENNSLRSFKKTRADQNESCLKSVKKIPATPILRTPRFSTSSRSFSVSQTSKPINRKTPEWIELKPMEEKKRVADLDHLKSHYNPAIGAYDMAYGETPEKAMKLETPRKEDKSFTRILRSPSPWRG